MTNLTPVFVWEVNQISVLHHVDPPSKDHGALGALDVQRFPLMCEGDMFIQLCFASISLATEVTNKLVGWRQTL